MPLSINLTSSHLLTLKKHEANRIFLNCDSLTVKGQYHNAFGKKHYLCFLFPIYDLTDVHNWLV